MIRARGRAVVGLEGEDAAAEYLQARGHKVLFRNWRCGHLEIDIVTDTENALHFVEVKSASGPVAVCLSDRITPAKIRNMTRAAKSFVRIYAVTKEVRFDLVSVSFGRGGSPIIEHVEDAFLPIF